MKGKQTKRKLMSCSDENAKEMNMSMQIEGLWNTYSCHDCDLLFAIKADTDTTGRAACPKCKQVLPVTHEDSDFVER